MLKKSIIILLLINAAQSFSSESCDRKWELLLDAGKLQINDYSLLGKCDFELRSILQSYSESGHNPHSYSDVLKFMYTKLDNITGQLCSVYTPTECNKPGEAKSYRINCEHTWPKSEGAKNFPMVSDLHHLYPSEKDINNLRANLPFCNVQEVEYEREGSKYGLGNSGITCFEPQDKHKGNVARSMFYFAVRYGFFIDKDQEKVLREWNKLDPVTLNDIRRNQMIKSYQGNSNPFVERSYLADLISDF